MSMLMGTYAHSPLWLQNLFVSGYGYILRQRRYGGRHSKYLSELMQSELYSEDQLRTLQLDRLNQTLVSARRTIPYYREAPLPVLPLTDLRQLADLPLLEKEDIRRHGARLVAPKAGRARRVIHTGGTTGKPLAIHCSDDTLRRNFAFYERLKVWAGIARHARVATFAGRTVVPYRQLRPPFWRYNAAMRTMLFSSYHLSRNSIPSYVAALASYAPDLIDSYPSSIEPIARYMLEHGIEDIRPKAIITSSETLTDGARSVIEAAFHCRVHDHYGGAEMAAFVSQCARGSYHVNPEFGVVEILRDGRPARPGELGEIVATGFINPTMPLIRYRTGDLAAWSGRLCACGRAFPILDRIHGRVDDVVITPEGRRIGRLDPIFKSIDHVYETVLIQDTRDHIRVQVVPLPGFTDVQEAILTRELRARIGETMKITVERVQSIPRTAAGKRRLVINLIASSTPPNEG